MIYKIEDVLEDIKNGIPLIIVDDENRENEGDLFVAAEKATYEKYQSYGNICKRVNLYTNVN